jgi:hypothetical protein
LDELRRELQVASEEIAHLKVERGKDRRTTNVLAAFIVAGGAIYLYNRTQSLMPYTAFLVWVVVSGAAGLAATLIFDNAKRLPLELERLEWIPAIVRTGIVTGIGIGGVFLAWSGPHQILRAVVGPAKYDTSGDAPMLTISLIVGAVVALSLRALGALSWLQRVWMP